MGSSGKGRINGSREQRVGLASGGSGGADGVGGGSGGVVARVSCCWCPAGSFVDAASPGKFPRPQAALEPIGSSPCSRLPLRAVHACLLRRTSDYLITHLSLSRCSAACNMSSIQQRKEEILAKKAKLAELKKQRELRQKEFTSHRQSLDAGEVHGSRPV